LIFKPIVTVKGKDRLVVFYLLLKCYFFVRDIPIQSRIYVTAILELVDKISLAISISLTSVDREENNCSVNNGKMSKIAKKSNGNFEKTVEI
jgi:hypothetical protein